MRTNNSTKKSTVNQSFIIIFSGVCVQRCMFMDVHVSVCLSLSVCLSVWLSGWLSVYLSVSLLLSYRCHVADGTRHYGGRGQAYDWQITQVLHTQPKPEARVHSSIKEFYKHNNKYECLHKQILQNTSVPTSKLTH